MISPTYRKILYGLASIGIVTILIMPDVVMGLLFELVHLFFELLFHIADISFEWIESTLDTLVEHLFHTDLHQTQIIVFYLLAGIAALPFYYLWRMLRRLFFYLRDAFHAVHAIWMHYKTRAALYWLDMSLFGKILLFAVFAFIIYLASMLFF